METERRSLPYSRVVKPAPEAEPVPIILFSAGGMRFAIEAGEVKEVRDYDESTTARKLRGAEPLDFALHVGLGKGILNRYVVLKPGECWLGVTEIERITSLPKVVALPRLFHGDERQWYRGLLLLENEVVPLIRTDYWRKLSAEVEASRG